MKVKSDSNNNIVFEIEGHRERLYYSSDWNLLPDGYDVIYTVVDTDWHKYIYAFIFILLKVNTYFLMSVYMNICMYILSVSPFTYFNTKIDHLIELVIEFELIKKSEICVMSQFFLSQN